MTNNILPAEASGRNKALRVLIFEAGTLSLSKYIWKYSHFFHRMIKLSIRYFFPKEIFKINIDYHRVKCISKGTSAATGKPLEETVPLNHYIYQLSMKNLHEKLNGKIESRWIPVINKKTYCPVQSSAEHIFLQQTDPVATGIRSYLLWLKKCYRDGSGLHYLLLLVLHPC